tara:strand:+ start:4273 stop:4434 length:162 start_codon:yes stop_codon:yes gene_type:complete
MKYILLLITIFFIFLFFRVFSSIAKKNNTKKNMDEEIIDLKKDPKTNEYKAKE